MKITILGSCLSGMALALRLIHSKHEVEICLPETGLDSCSSGYLFNSVTLESLTSLGLNLRNWVTPLRGGRAHAVSDQIEAESGSHLFSADSLRLHQEIQKSVGKERYRFDSRFSHFEPRVGYHIKSAHFENGTEAMADLFVGADGVQSVVRKKQVPGPVLSMVETHQISGTSRICGSDSLLRGRVISYKVPQTSGELIIYPVDSGTVSWRLQVDARGPLHAGTSSEELRQQVFKWSRNWQTELHPIFEESAITAAQASKCSDRRLPHLFHKDNVVLIGKAAHPTLPDLYSGVDSDLEDALLLGDLLDEFEKGHFESLDICLTEFIRQRRPLLNSRIRRARAQQKRVLSTS